MLTSDQGGGALQQFLKVGSISIYLFAVQLAIVAACAVYWAPGFRCASSCRGYTAL
jgi:hypothetical protein